MSLGSSLALEAEEPVLLLLTSVTSLKVEVLCGSNILLTLQLWIMDIVAGKFGTPLLLLYGKGKIFS